MKLRVLAASLLVSGCAPGYYIFGDSMTSQPYSWANQMVGYNKQIMAVPGLRFVDFDMPSWIKPTKELRGVIFFLGGNDVGSRVPLEDFEDAVIANTTVAKLLNLSVLCVDIPIWPKLDKPEYQAYRDILHQHCETMLYIAVTPEVMQDSDGLHWGPKGSAVAARQIEEQLAEIQ